MQQPLPSLNNQLTLSFQDIAEDLKVSEATIKNWVKTGALKQINANDICARSYKVFKDTVVGKEKLNKRANKLQLDATNHQKIYAEIQRRINDVYQGAARINGGDLSSDYEGQLGDAHKNAEGIFYTPSSIASELLSCVDPITEDTTFCDPCCGAGSVLMAALEKGIKPENIYGFDTDKTAVEIAKSRIFKATSFKGNNIKVDDFLERMIQSSPSKTYDLVFTNPPWGKKYAPRLKQKYADAFNNGTKIDSSAIFSMACLRVLNADGYLGLLLPDAFFNVAAYKSVRAQLLNNNILYLADHKKPFKGLQTRAQSIVLKLNNAQPPPVSVTCKFDDNIYKRSQSEFSNNPNCIYNFHTSSEDAALIKHIFSHPHTTLKDKAQWGLGIVTGNNKKYVGKDRTSDCIPVFKGSDIHKSGFNPPSHFIPKDFSKYQQVAPIALYEAPEKIVYRFISSNLVFSYDDQQRFVLNSANFLVLDKGAGLSAQNLTFLLNTKLMNWLFGKIFRTHKILRSDIETLPIFTEYFDSDKQPTEQALYAYLGIKEINGQFKKLRLDNI